MTTEQRRTVGREEFDDLKKDITGAITDIGSTMGSMKAQLDAISEADHGRDRLSREQEMSAHSPTHEAYEHDDDLIISHPALKPQEGYAQMWVRVTIDGKPDSGNVLRMRAPQRGWKPRSADTLPPDLAEIMKVKMEDQNVIQYRDLMLYERPLSKHEKEIAKTQHTADMQMTGIEQDLRRVHEGGQSGFSAPKFTERRRVVETGNRPASVD